MSNYKFKTTNIRGKQYVEVNERIKFFRQEDEYKNWTISTEFTALDSEMCVCKCIIADTSQRVVATGHAHEERSSSHINKTSYVENCETSAIGRALAMMGIGIDTSIASANEVQDAIAKQEEKPASKKAEAPVENIMDKAIGYIKSSTDKRQAFDSIMAKYADQLTEKQVAGIKKFVR
tara:strand:+ start:2589 stop:3122 length:534 start_codon:yes stop_codon:yes gene_type:complete